jgi:KUP system potassium uptake protein
MVVLATMATVIASQALISGAFSLTTQAMRLDYLPRLQVRHTSSEHQGQVYVPIVNWILMVACIGLVVGFQTSSRLAAAYGVAVTMTMAITTMLFIDVARNRWGWSKAKTLTLQLPLLTIDLAFVFAQVVKIPNGGWFALAVGLTQFALMTTWHTGRKIVSREIRRAELPIDEFVESLETKDYRRVHGTSVFLFKDVGAAPPALLANLRHNRVVHDHVLLVSVDVAGAAEVPAEHRATVEEVGPGMWQIVLTFGFMDRPDVPAALEQLGEERRIQFDASSTTYFLGRETVVATPAKNMHPLREHLFVLQNRTAASAARFFCLPSRSVYEVGTTIEL